MAIEDDFFDDETAEAEAEIAAEPDPVEQDRIRQRRGRNLRLLHRLRTWRRMKRARDYVRDDPDPKRRHTLQILKGEI